MKNNLLTAAAFLAACGSTTIEITSTADGDDGETQGRESSEVSTGTGTIGQADSTGSGASSTGASTGEPAGPLDIVVIVDPSLVLNPYADHLSGIMQAVADGAGMVDAHLAVTTPSGAPWNTTCEVPGDFLTRNVFYPCEGWGAPYMAEGDDYNLGMACAGLVPTTADIGPNATMQTMLDVLTPAPCRGDWRRDAPLLYVLVTARDDNGSLGSPFLFGKALHKANGTTMATIYARPCDAVLPNLDEMVLAVNDEAVTYVNLCDPLINQSVFVDAIVAAAS